MSSHLGDHWFCADSGTYVNQQYPFDPKTPTGCWEYHGGKELIAASPKLPLRVALFNTERDNGHGLPERTYHNWCRANTRMATILKAKGCAPCDFTMCLELRFPIEGAEQPCCNPMRHFPADTTACIHFVSMPATLTAEPLHTHSPVALNGCGRVFDSPNASSNNALAGTSTCFKNATARRDTPRKFVVNTDLPPHFVAAKLRVGTGHKPFCLVPHIACPVSFYDTIG